MNIIPKKTKIVCTIGPSSWDPEVMRKMIEAGMNSARVNGAFADTNELDKVTKLVRDVSDEVSLMMDVKGPEVRMNKFHEPKQIRPGDEIVIGNDDSAEIFPANYKDLYKSLKKGQRLVVGDGDVEMKIMDIKGDKMYCEVVFGETLKPGKALNLPGATVSKETLTEKDITNLKHSLKLDWDFVSASFIQNAKAAKIVNKYLEGSNMKLIAKIEDQQGVDNIDEILQEVEGIMVARGGLGVELGLEKVPMVQRHLIERANAVGKPVITATQMLESMTSNARPTRAEVNDVATAIMLGTDAVMLSAESSAGKYPVEAVKELTKIALEIEQYIEPAVIQSKPEFSNMADGLAKAAANMCMSMQDEISAVIIASRTGVTPRFIGRHRIKQPIYAFVSNDSYKRRTTMNKGVIATFVLDKFASRDRDAAVKELMNQSLKLGIVKPTDTVLIIGKTPANREEYYPSIFEVAKVKDALAE